MVRNPTDILRSSATNRRGATRPVGMGMKQYGRTIPCLLGTLPLCLVSAVDGAHAQSASRDSEVLPAIEVVAPTTTAARPARNRAAPQAPRNVRRVLVYPTAPTPTARTGMDVDKVPAAINAVGAGADRAHESLNIGGRAAATGSRRHPQRYDRQSLHAGHSVSRFHGIAGCRHPQGLAVYQNGMRINEAFGDTVNWDLIPTAAIRSVTVVTNNPAFGLNALGGAVNVLMKDGFSYQGAETNVMGGSFGRVQGSAQAGKQVGNYVGLWRARGRARQRLSQFWESADPSLLWRCRLPDRQQRVPPQCGRRQEQFWCVGGGAGRTAAEILGRDLHDAADHRQPRRLRQLDRKGGGDPDLDARRFGAGAQRSSRRRWTATRPRRSRVRADRRVSLLQRRHQLANGVNGGPIANPFPADAVLGQIDRTTTRSTTTGATLQATNTDQLFGHNNQFMVGTSFDFGVTRFGASAELGTIGSNYVVNGSGIFLGPSGSRFRSARSRFAPPTATPGSTRSTRST